MKGRNKRKLMVQDLLLDGYSQEKIAGKLNVSISTVERDVRKLRESGQRWLDDLFPKKMVYIFREGLEGIKKDMITLREMLDEESVKNNVILRLKILKEISELRGDYLEMLTKTPLVWSVAKFVKDNGLKRNDGKPQKTVYGELKAYEYQESSSQTQSYSDPYYENKLKNG